MQKIIANKIRCKYCGGVIESKNLYDFQFCKCGRVGVYGGTRFLSRIAIFSHDDYEDLSEYEDVPDDLPRSEK